MNPESSESSKHPRWFVVANPAAGRGRAAKKIDCLDALCRRAGLRAQIALTEEPLHACELARKAVGDGFERFLVAGGDGSVHEVLNGMFLADRHATRDFLLGLLPLGSANDWARSLALPADWDAILELARKERAIAHDVGVVDCQGTHGERRHYFVNVAGVGFDAHVLQAMDAEITGRWKYLLTAIRELWRYPTQTVRIRAGDRTIDTRMLGLFTGPGRFFGGRLEILPGARCDSGSLRATLVHDANRWRILFSLLPRLFNGSMENSRLVDTLLAREIVIDCPKGRLFLEGDGELLGCTPARFSILPGALRVLSVRQPT